MPARSPRCGQKSRAVKPDPHPRLPPKGGSVGRSAAEDGKKQLFGLGVPILPAKNPKMCARERALCVRQNWGHRAKSCFLPLLIRLARLSRTKPRGRACIRRLRRPYAVQKKRIESDGSQPAKADSALPSHLLRIMETARLSNAPASAAGAMLWSCALFSWHERRLEITPLLAMMAP